MNKQVILAALAGVASAQQACDGPFVDEAQDNLDMLTQEKADADGMVAALAASLAATQTAFDATALQATNQDTLMAPFNTALATATANKDAQTAIVTAATAALAVIDVDTTAATTAKTTAAGLVAAKNTDITAQGVINAKLDAAVAEHTTELATMQGLLDTATTAATAAATALTNKTAEKNTADGGTAGNRGDAATPEAGTTRKDLADAQAAQSTHTAGDLATQASGYATAKTNAKTPEVAYQKADVWYQSLLAACDTFSSTNSVIASGKACGTSATATAATAGVAPCQAKAVTVEAGAAGTCKVFEYNTSGDVCKCCSAYDVAGRTVSATTTIYTLNGKCAYNAAVATHGMDPLSTLKAAALATRDGLTSPTTTNTALGTARGTYVTELALADEHIAKVAYYTDVDTTQGLLVTSLGVAETTLTGAKTTADAAQTTAQTNWNTVNGQLTQATADQTRGAAVLAALSAALVPLQDDLTVKTYLEQVQLDKQTTENARKTAANALLPNLTTLQTMAQETVTRATTTKTFYDANKVEAQATLDLDQGAVDANAAKITALTAAIEGATDDLAVAVATCKGLGYDRAQKAAKDQIDQDADDAAAATVVAADYNEAAAFSTSGETNTLCAYPPATADGQGPRPVCKDGFCCGAAQKFLKDGTKLAIETCQAETGVHTYQYYPPLPAGAPVAPTPETWRFQCISGAQKLVATATAALAASYLMA